HVPQVRVRPGRRGRRRGRHRHDHRGHVRAAGRVVVVHPGGQAMTATATRVPVRGVSRTGAAARRRARRDPTLGQRGGPVWALVTWAVTLLFFAPVAWMVLTSFHHEADAATNPPSPLASLTVD